MTKQFSNYSDLITFTRASKGHALRPVSYGAELSEGSDFSSWDNNSTFPFDTFTASSSSLTVANSTSKTSATTHPDSISLVSGRLYVIDLEFSIASGTVDFSVREQATATVIAEGADVGAGETQQRITFVSNVTTLVVIQLTTRSGTVNATLDNVSVKEVTFDESDGTLTLFEHPENVPRVEYDADGNRLGLLVEEQRVNQFIQSENFNLGAWGRARAVPVKNAVGPTGVANSAVTLSDNASGDTSSVYIQETVTGLTTGDDYTASVFVKKGSLNFLGLKAASLGLTGSQAYFDLANGTIGSVGSDLTATMKDYGNGWYRCSITFTAGSDTAGTIRIQMWEQITGGNFLHDGTKNILIFGAQFEEGSFPTSYIKSNQGVQTARSADVASIPVADFGFNANEGTLFVNCLHFGDASERPLSMSDGSNTSQAFFKIATGSDPISQVVTAGVSIAQLDTTSARDSGYKAAMTVKENDFAMSVDGNSVAVDTNGGIGTYSIIHIGRRQDGLASTIFNGHIKSIKYYPRRLTNAQLQELTS